MRALCLLVAAICVIGAGCGGDDGDAASAWNHNPADAALGPNGWSELEGFEECGTGREQSPVDVTAAVDAELPPLELDYPAATPGVVANTGHTVEVVMRESARATLTIAGTQYRLLQYHFHAPSEHTLGGRSFPAEVHLVHQSDEGELAVIGVFLEEGLRSTVADTIIDSAPAVAGEEVDVDDAVMADASSGRTNDDYYSYTGSLTMPACTEGVRWIVMVEPAGISAEAAARLHDLIAGFPSYDGYANNNRPTQPLNARTVRRDAG